MKSKLAEYAPQKILKNFIDNLEKDINDFAERMEDLIFNSLFEQCGENSIEFIIKNQNDVQQMLDDLYIKYAKDYMYRLYRMKELLQN